MKNSVVFLIIALLAISSGFYFVKQKDKRDLLTPINRRVLDTIAHAESIPGLKSEEVAAFKKDIESNWKALFKNKSLEVLGADKDIRPSFVAIQAIVEHVLSVLQSQKEISTLEGIIHTPMPATPLCTTGEISKGLISAEIEKDPKRLYTVKSRATVVRDFLHQGGILYIVYPKEGLGKRTEEQQTIYKKELAYYSRHLFDRPLDCSLIPDELIGATYLFSDKEGKRYAFSIKMSQAKEPKDAGSFGLWLGLLEDKAVSKRVSEILTFLDKEGMKNLSAR